MKSHLHRIEIRNFKAFREFELNLEGRHLLVYGANGSGKSSLYWALYTFLQSAGKPTPEVAKYFDPDGDQWLLNIHEDVANVPGEIVVTCRDTATRNDTTYRISLTDHGTRNQSAILKGDLASDFITYRFFFGFSHFRYSEKFNIWPLFEKEILPFCVSTGGKSPLQCWKSIKSGKPNPLGSRGLGGSYSYDDFIKNAKELAAILGPIVESISNEAQRFYDRHFAEGDPAPVKLALKVTQMPEAAGSRKSDFKFTKPAIEFGIQVNGRMVRRPQAFLNEAKMTQLALSVRFAASLVNLHESDLKLLVLDDLLISLDMSNRMKVVEILLTDPALANYQKIILTHDLGFFREFRRIIGTLHQDWSFIRLVGDPASKIKAVTEKTELQKAEDYLQGHDLDEAALCLRKAAENTAARFLDRENVVDPTKEFTSLREDLRAARNKVLSELPVGLYEKVLRNTPDGHHSFLLPANDSDLEDNTTLDAATIGKLKCQRKRLRRLLTEDHHKQLKRVKLIDDILSCTERVLNPAAHGGNPPLYEKEVANAVDLIQQLENALPCGETK